MAATNILDWVCEVRNEVLLDPCTNSFILRL